MTETERPRRRPHCSRSPRWRCRPAPRGSRPTSSPRISRRSPAGRIAGDRIDKTFPFDDYHETMAFVNALAWIAHREDHHPDLGRPLQPLRRHVLDARRGRRHAERRHLRGQGGAPVRLTSDARASSNGRRDRRPSPPFRRRARRRRARRMPAQGTLDAGRRRRSRVDPARSPAAARSRRSRRARSLVYRSDAFKRKADRRERDADRRRRRGRTRARSRARPSLDDRRRGRRLPLRARRQQARPAGFRRAARAPRARRGAGLSGHRHVRRARTSRRCGRGSPDSARCWSANPAWASRRSSTRCRRTLARARRKSRARCAPAATRRRRRRSIRCPTSARRRGSSTRPG